MPDYVWSCLACGRANPADAEGCSGCGCSARATQAQIEAAQARAKPTVGVKLATPGVLRVLSGVLVLLVGGFFVRWSDSLVFTALGVVLVVVGTIIVGKRHVG